MRSEGALQVWVYTTSALLVGGYEREGREGEREVGGGKR